MSTYKVIKSQYVSNMCAVCGRTNPFSLHGHFYVLENGLLYSVFEPIAEHQSYPGRVHGGMVAAIIDEVIGRVVNTKESVLNGEEPEIFGVTMDLKTRYRKPTPYGEPLYCIARVLSETKRFIEGEAFLYTMDGTLCAQGSARYIKLPTDSISDGGINENDWFADPDPTPRTIEIPTLPE